jgi:predicted Rossmann fold nucleotide-binding protein DprA/Smf involved in DNA uptake
MTRAVAISGTRRTKHLSAAEVEALFDRFLTPFIDTGTLVFVGGAKGIDTLALIWLVEQTVGRLCVVVPGTVEGQPEESQAAIEAAQAVATVDVVQLRHSEFPSTASYHHRNRWMVDRADLLTAFPRRNVESTSGTNYTIDYAAERGLPRIIVPI